MADAVQLVWFKRDLRIADHRPLHEAAARGPVLPLYIIEPSLLRYPDYAPRHWAFTYDCLVELRDRLGALGMPLVVRHGEALEVFEELYRQHAFTVIWAHEETGNRLTYDRDRAIRRWTRKRGIPFDETPAGGVVRALDDRNRWTRIWESRMRAPVVSTPASIRPVTIDIGSIPTASELGLSLTSGVELQRGGESHAHDTLHSFLEQRGSTYHKAMSSPNTAFDACSRLSTHFAYGTMSVRQVSHMLGRRRAALYDLSDDAYRALDGAWKSALRAFESRLHWRDHFIQKLETEPRIEYENFVRAYDGLREPGMDEPEIEDRLAAWCAGATGYPMVDASMRALHATGWINFRMRAMLVSFASYDLWLHWRQTGLHLARLFTDYEPGIHFSQMQMQSGTTGINTLRIYNPSKQGIDHDPAGTFIRRWVPELAAVPLEHLHQPWAMPGDLQQKIGCVIGRDYPAPIVEHRDAVHEARSMISAVRRRPETRAEADRIVLLHGSRKRPSRRPRPKREVNAAQLSLTPPVERSADRHIPV